MRRWTLIAVGVVVALVLLTQPAATDPDRFTSVDDLAAALECEPTPTAGTPRTTAAASCRLAPGQTVRLYWFASVEDRRSHERLGVESGIRYLGHEHWLISAHRTSTLRRVQESVGGEISKPWLLRRG